MKKFVKKISIIFGIIAITICGSGIPAAMTYAGTQQSDYDKLIDAAQYAIAMRIFTDCFSRITPIENGKKADTTNVVLPTTGSDINVLKNLSDNELVQAPMSYVKRIGATYVKDKETSGGSLKCNEPGIVQEFARVLGLSDVNEFKKHIFCGLAYDQTGYSDGAMALVSKDKDNKLTKLSGASCVDSIGKADGYFTVNNYTSTTGVYHGLEYIAYYLQNYFRQRSGNRYVSGVYPFYNYEIGGITHYYGVDRDAYGNGATAGYEIYTYYLWLRDFIDGCAEGSPISDLSQTNDTSQYIGIPILDQFGRAEYKYYKVTNPTKEIYTSIGDPDTNKYRAQCKAKDGASTRSIYHNLIESMKKFQKALGYTGEDTQNSTVSKTRAENVRTCKEASVKELKKIADELNSFVGRVRMMLAVATNTTLTYGALRTSVDKLGSDYAANFQAINSSGNDALWARIKRFLFTDLFMDGDSAVNDEDKISEEKRNTASALRGELVELTGYDMTATGLSGVIEHAFTEFNIAWGSLIVQLNSGKIGWDFDSNTQKYRQISNENNYPASYNLYDTQLNNMLKEKHTESLKLKNPIAYESKDDYGGIICYGTQSGGNPGVYDSFVGYLREALELDKFSLPEVDETEYTTILPAGQTIDPEPEEGGEGSAAYEADYCYANGGTLSWVLCPALKAMGSIGQHMYNQIEQNHLKIQANAMFAEDSGLNTAWSNIRNYVNIGFVIFLFIIILSQLTGFGIDNYGIKRMLPKFLVAIVLVNLSFIIMQIAVDLSNILGMSLNNMLSGLAGKIQIKREIAYGGATLGSYMKAGAGIIGFLLLGGAAGLIAVYKTSVKTGSSLLGGLILLLVMIVVIVVVAMLTLYLTLVAREVGIIFVIVVAPAALLCRILPNTEKLYKKWFEMAKGLLMLYPICGLVIGMGRLGSSILVGIADSMESNGGSGSSMYTAAAIVQVIAFFFIPTLLKQSMAAMGNIGAKIMGMGNRLGRSAARDAAGFIGSRDRFKKWDKNRQDNWKNWKENRGINRDARKAYKREHGNSVEDTARYQRLQAAKDAGAILTDKENAFIDNFEQRQRKAKGRYDEDTENFNQYKEAMQRRADGTATKKDYETINKYRKLAFDRSQQVADQRQATDAYKAAAQTGFFSMAGARQSMTQQINSQVQKEEQNMYADQASLMSRSQLMGTLNKVTGQYEGGALLQAIQDGDINKVIAFMQAAESRGFEKEMASIFNSSVTNDELDRFGKVGRQSIFSQAAASKDINMKAWGKNMGKMSEFGEVSYLDDTGAVVKTLDATKFNDNSPYLTPAEFNSGKAMVDGAEYNTDLSFGQYLEQKGSHILDGQSDDSIDNITKLVESGKLKVNIETVINGMNSTKDGKELTAFGNLAEALGGIGNYKMSASQASKLNADSFNSLVNAMGPVAPTQIANMLQTYGRIITDKNMLSNANPEMMEEFRKFLTNVTGKSGSDLDAEARKALKS